MSGITGTVGGFTYVVPMMCDADHIANLVYQYAELMDDGHFDEAAKMFIRATFPMPHGDLDHNSMRDLWEAMVIRYPDGTPRTVHQTTNLIIEVDGATATCRSRFTVLQQTDTLSLQAICSGRYADTFAKTEGAWHFTSRRYSMTLTGDTSQHMRV